MARSQRIGLRLYGMAELPTCFLPKGSSISLSIANRRISLQMRCTLAANDASTKIRSASTLRGVRLPADTHDFIEAEVLDEVGFEFADFDRTAQELEERRLRAGGAAQGRGRGFSGAACVRFR